MITLGYSNSTCEVNKRVARGVYQDDYFGIKEMGQSFV